MKDYYYILGISKNASSEEIKKAYRKLSLKFHPDKNEGDSFFVERFKDIREAYETLSDFSKKAIYDANLQAHLNGNNTYDFERRKREEEFRHKEEEMKRKEEEFKKRQAQQQAYNAQSTYEKNTSQRTSEAYSQPSQTTQTQKSTAIHREEKKANPIWVVVGFIIALLGGYIGMVVGTIFGANYIFGNYDKKTITIGWIMLIVSLTFPWIILNSLK